MTLLWLIPHGVRVAQLATLEAWAKRSTQNRVQVNDLPAAATGGGDHAPTLRSWPGGSTATARVAFSIRGRFLAKGGKPCDRRGDGGHDDRPREPSKVNT